MRNYNSTFHVKNGLTGVIFSTGATAATLQGNVIDTIGFGDMLAVLCVGSLRGTGAAVAACNLTVKIQESATVGTNWTNITDGAINGTATVKGSATFDVLEVAGGIVAHSSGQYQRKMYLSLNDGIRQRYLRVNASVLGTSTLAAQFAVSVAIMLGRPVDSNYIIDAISVATNVQTEIGFANGKSL